MTIELWQLWLVIAVTINTIINLIVFFKGRKIKDVDKKN
jgi:hypothetical protein